jgi:hypothetical protein
MGQVHADPKAVKTQPQLGRTLGQDCALQGCKVGITVSVGLEDWDQDPLGPKDGLLPRGVEMAEDGVPGALLEP